MRVVESLGQVWPLLFFRQSSLGRGLEHGWLSTNGEGKCRGLHHHSCEIPSPKNRIIKTEVAGFQVSVVARVMMSSLGSQG